jgi:hypothetical protein
MDEDYKVPEIVDKLNAKFLQRRKDLEAIYSVSSCHFEDIAGNLYNGLKLTTSNVRDKITTWERNKKTYIECATALDTYLNLLHLNLEFAQSEFDPEAKEGAYVPEVRERWNKGEVRNYHAEYVVEAAKKLLK